MIDERANGVWISKIHAQPNAGVLKRFSVEVGDVNGVSEVGFVNGLAEKVDEHEMELMNVEGVELGRAIFDDPVFDVPLLCDDVGNIGSGIERDRSLAVEGEEKSCGAVGIVGIEELF